MNKTEILKNTYKVLSSISPTMSSKLMYRITVKKKLNLKNPKLFNEKLMWLKLNLYKNNPLITECVDKYRVREYIKRCGCSELLNELIGVYDSVDEIDFSKLPDKFVLKCNHGAGYNILCKNKNELNINETKQTLKKWLKEDYWKRCAEINYKKVPKKIICEKFLENENKEDLEDYKIYCFNGIPQFVMICVGRNAKQRTKYYFMNKEWKIMKINPAGIETPENFKIEKPKCIDEMFEYAQTLSKPFPFVRVDFYCVKDKTIFGELTFTPAGCIDTNYIGNAQEMLGNMIDLSKYIR